MAKKVIVFFLACIFLFMFFLFLRLLYCQSWFSTVKLSNELIPIDVLNLFSSTAITLFLAWYVTKKLTEQRYEKEFVMADLKNIEDQINYIERMTSDLNSIQLQPLLDLLAKLQSHIDRFKKTTLILKIPCKDSKELDSSFVALFEKATDIDGHQLDIDSAKRIEIQKVCSDFIITTRSIVCKINKL